MKKHGPRCEKIWADDGLRVMDPITEPEDEDDEFEI